MRRSGRMRRLDRRRAWGAVRVEALEDRRLMAAPVVGSGRLVVADFNGDGLPDRAEVGPDVPAAVRITLGAPRGTFGTPRDYQLGTSFDSIAAGDFDDDGKLDLVAVREGIGTLVWLGRGDGQFALNTAEPAPDGPAAVTVGDLDGDGTLDLALAYPALKRVGVRLGHGDGTFGGLARFDSVGRVNALAVADYDGDGRRDVVAASGADGRLDILLGTGDGSLTAVVSTVLSTSPVSLALADFDGDGTLDVSTADAPVGDATTGTVSIYRNRGFHTVWPGTSYEVPRPAGVVVPHDLNADGVVDLAVSYAGEAPSAGALLGTGDGTGSLGPAFDFASGRAPVALSRSILGAGPSAVLVDAAGFVLDVRLGSDPGVTDIEGLDVVGTDGVPMLGESLATFVDPAPGTSPDPYEARIDWGDGTSSTGTVRYDGEVYSGRGPRIGSQFSVESDHTYRVAASYHVVVSIFKGGAGPVLAVGTAVVADGAPTAIGTTLPAAEGVAVAGSVATFTDTADERPVADYQAAIDWMGMHDATPGIITADVRDGRTVYEVAVPSGVVFTRPGTYPVLVTITDKAGNQAVATGSVVVGDAQPVFDAPEGAIGATTGRATGSIVVAHFADGDPSSTSSGFAATIDWGDGSGPVAASIVANREGGFDVLGGHTYGRTGNVTVVVRVTDRETGASYRFDREARVTSPVPPTLTGALDPSSDTGASSADGITSDRQPEYRGTTTPGAQVFLYAEPPGASEPETVGFATADASGSWRTTMTPLVDQTYAMTAAVVGAGGVLSASVPLGTLVIDATAPTVVGVEFNPATGFVRVRYRDGGAGLDPMKLNDGSLYRLAPEGDALGRSSPVIVFATGSTAPSGELAVSMSFRLDRMPASGPFVFGIAPGVVKDRAGNLLDGEFLGQFPSGSGQPGGGFEARFVPGAPGTWPSPGTTVRPLPV